MPTFSQTAFAFKQFHQHIYLGEIRRIEAMSEAIYYIALANIHEITFYPECRRVAVTDNISHISMYEKLGTEELYKFHRSLCHGIGCLRVVD